MAAIPEANRARRVARHDREVGEEEHRPHERRLAPSVALEHVRHRRVVLLAGIATTTAVKFKNFKFTNFRLEKKTSTAKRFR